MERYVQMLVEGLIAQGFTVSALCPFESRFTLGLRALGCPVSIAMVEEALEWRSLLTATELIRRQQIDVVHTHLFNATLLGSLAGNLSAVPVVVTVHGMTLNPEDVALARLVGSHLITVCSAAYNMGLALGLPEEQISLVPNGVDTQRFRPDVSSAAFRQRLQIPEDAPLVGMVARLAREKGPDQFVRAATLVAGMRPDAHFCLVGEGPLHNDLVREIQAAHLQGRFHLVGMAADTTIVYPALDVVCLPSRIEGQPLTLLEAMAAGRPVVATNVGGIPELVEMGETGWLVAQGDMKSMSERIVELLENPDRAREMGRAGRQRVSEHFDIRTQTARVAAIFRQLTEGRRPQSLTTLRLGRVYNHVRVS